MIGVLKNNVSAEQEQAVVEEIKKLGYQPHVMHGVARTVIGAIGDELSHNDLDVLNAWPQVESVTPIQKRHKLVSREAHPENSTVNAGGVIVGGKTIQIIAGPCSVENEEQLMKTAHAV